MVARPEVIRKGDVVRVVIPTFVRRVGYPKEVRDYLTQEVMERAVDFCDGFRRRGWGGASVDRPTMLSGEYNPSHLSKQARRVAMEAAYLLARADRFGGRERRLHLVEVPRHRDATFAVLSTRVAKTGLYFPPSGGVSWEGESDWDSGGLMDEKTHVLLVLDVLEDVLEFGREVESGLAIERENVVLVRRAAEKHVPRRSWVDGREIP